MISTLVDTAKSKFRDTVRYPPFLTQLAVVEERLVTDISGNLYSVEMILTNIYSQIGTRYR